MVLVTGGLALRLPEFRVDNSDESFLHPEDPARQRYDRFLDQFGRDERILVSLSPPEIFDLGFLETLRSLHEDIENEVPYLEEVTSLVNARNTRGEGDELIVEDLLEDWPESEADLQALRERVLSNRLYVGSLITANASHTLLNLKTFTYSTRGPERDELGGFGDDELASGDDHPPFLSEEEEFELTVALRKVVDRYAGPELDLHVLGGPIYEYHVFHTMQNDVTVLMSLSIVLIMLLLYVLFRRVSAVLLPVVVVLSAALSTMGLMVWLDIPFSVTLNMLPAFLMVVGVCDSIHILAIAYRRMAAGRSREEAMVEALGHSGLAVVMTSVTTAAGLLSFRVAEIAPIAQLGLLAPAGVILAMLYSLVLLPALFAVLPLRHLGAEHGVAARGLVDAFLARIGDLSTAHPWRVGAAAAAIVLVGLPGVLRVGFSHDGMRWLPDGDPFKEAWQTVDSQYGGFEALEVLIDSGSEDGLHEPGVLRRIERAMQHTESLSVGGHPVNKAISIVDVVKETHQALNENRRTFYALPDDRRLVAQELLLFENSGSDDLGDVTDTRFRVGRMTVFSRSGDALVYPPYLRRVAADLREILGEDLAFEFTGGLAVYTRVFEAVIHTMARSYAFALLVITPIMILLIGNLKRGLLAMIPNLIPIYLVLAFMGWTGIPLDASTLLIGGVIIGLAVDDTIHFMHKFGRYLEDSGDAAVAVHETLATTGSALLFTSLTLALGFASFLGSYMLTTFWFGLLACIGIVVAFLGDVVLAPALMVLATRE